MRPAAAAAADDDDDDDDAKSKHGLATTLKYTF